MKRAPEAFYPDPGDRFAARLHAFAQSLAAIGILAQNSRVKPVPDGTATH